MENRLLRQEMIALSNNSRLTNSVVELLISKLSDNEQSDLRQWLRLVDQERQIAVEQAKRTFPFR